MGDDFESRSCFGDVVVVAHPADGGGLNILEHLAAVVHKDLGLAVLTLRGARQTSTAQQVHHQLAAVADAQHRHTPAEDLGVDGGRVLQINAVGPPVKMMPFGFLALMTERSVL